MIPIAGLLPEQLTAALKLERPFRGRQLFRWVQRLGVLDFHAMSDLPEALRAQLAARASCRTLEVTGSLEDPDGTLKLRFELDDRAVVEAVLLADERERATACLSTQAGCAMGCFFCRTGQLGLRRNLAAHEIVEQFLLLRQRAGRLDNVVFMGMGEPLANLAEVAQAVRVLTAREGAALSPRRITVSTCGLAAGLLRLAEELPGVRLAVSLITADPALRAELMPVARSNPLPELRRSLLIWQRLTGKRFTLEVVLMQGVNDRAQDVQRLLEFVRGQSGQALKALVNLIPWNPVPGLPYQRPAPERVRWFAQQLEQARVPVSTRSSRGGAVSGACGQLGGA